MKVLLAEDDPTSAMVVRRSLEKLGHEVTVADTGKAAWALLSNTHSFRVLISDWMMPEMDGIELVRRLRARKPENAASYIYAILLTARGTPQDRLEGLAAGADDFLVKPLDQGDLVARLEVAKRILALQENAEANSVARFGNGQGGGPPLGEVLVEMGVISRDQLRHAVDQHQRTGQMIGLTLMANGWVTEEIITQARARQMDVPYVSVRDQTPDPALLDLVPVSVARKYQMIPLYIRTGTSRASDVVCVAVTNPWNIEGLDTIQRLTGKRAEPLLSSESGMTIAFALAYKDAEVKRQGDLLAESLEQAGVDGSSPLATGGDEDLDAIASGDEAPIIRLVNDLFSEAVRRRASDIHIEPYKKDFEIRCRIDGDLQIIRTLPRAALAAATSRIKVMADLDISERRVPQDGRISLRVDGRGIDLRVSSLPTQFGERLVMRILDRAAARLSLDQLDFSARNRKIFESLIRRPHGIILVTGPTGSGKTTTLYASLNALRSTTTNIMTCEDPIEYELDRISQSAVNPKAGLTFAGQLRAILRQDPDVVLVGEIRDAETAETAFRAALTGHLVLSTLHCNEAAGAPTRLLDMGVPAYLIASALIGVVGQRLLKRLCPACHRSYMPTQAQKSFIEAIAGHSFVPDQLYEPVGCDLCEKRGVKGRIGTHEVLAIDDAMRAIILKTSETSLLRNTAIASGFVPMAGDGLEKAGVGLTTLEEVQRRLVAEFGVV